jgi:hypothetical protein
MMVFVNVYIHFRIWTRIRNPRVRDPDPAKVPHPCRSGSGSTTLLSTVIFTFSFRVRRVACLFLMEGLFSNLTGSNVIYTFNFRVRRVACRLLMEGFVSSLSRIIFTFKFRVRRVPYLIQMQGFGSSLSKIIFTFSFRVRRVACRFLMEGFVSKAWLRRFFLALAIAAAAATPTGPGAQIKGHLSVQINSNWDPTVIH